MSEQQQQSVFETYLLPRPNPTSKHNPNPYLSFSTEDSSVYATPPEIPNTRRRPKPCEKFQFSHIFPDDSNTLGGVFQTTASPLLERLLQGKDSLLFTLGVTGSGKTHTVFGEPSNPGIIPLSLRSLFDAIEEQKASRVDFDCIPTDVTDKNGITLHAKDIISTHDITQKTRARKYYTFPDHANDEALTAREGEKYAICISFFELYQDRIYDLFDDVTSLIQKRKHLPLKRDVSTGRRFVSGLRKIYCDTAEEAFQILSRGLSSRQSNETAMNMTSSRSHAIFTIELRTFYTQTQTTHTSTLNIVDLAGSERSKGSTQDRLAEAGSINRSLMVLGQCIEVLRSQRRSHPALNNGVSSVTGYGQGVIPFRQNKLTELLFGNAILRKGGETRCVMIVNLNMMTSYEENVGVLRYASLAHEIEALPASELGGSMSRSASGEVRAEADWNEKLAQMEFLLREEECKRIDAEEKYAILEQEMISQSQEMEEKMAEMERMYMYRLLEQNQRSYDLTDAKLDIMASSMSTLSISPLLESKDSQIRILEDENLSLKQELESLRVGFRDEPKTPLKDRTMRYNAPGSVRSVSKKKLRTVKSIFDLNADID